MTQNIISTTMINGLTVGILTARSLAFCAFIAVAHCVNTVMVQYVIDVALRNYLQNTRTDAPLSGGIKYSIILMCLFRTSDVRNMRSLLTDTARTMCKLVTARRRRGPLSWVG